MRALRGPAFRGRSMRATGPASENLHKSGHKPASFDYLVSSYEQTGRHRQAERLGSFQVDGRFIFCRRLYRQVGGLLAAQDTVDIGRRLPILSDEIGAVGHETTGRDERT